jgi:hypothetical protein
VKPSPESQRIAETIARQCYAFIQGLPTSSEGLAQVELIAYNANTLLSRVKAEARVTS